jgi:transcriptional activator of cad operon
MERSNPTMLRIGDWCVDPRSGEISRDGTTTRLEARTMRLLLHLAAHAGEVVSIDDLLKHVWSGVIVTSDSVYQAVAALRRVLGDDPKKPAYIATVPRLGYRMVAVVAPWPDPAKNTAAPRARSRIGLTWSAAAVLCVAVAGAVWLSAMARNDRRATANASIPQRSIAVLPFLDLTEAMDEEPFADGITEELIGRLGRIPSLRVPAPRSSFYFKGKQLPVAVIADSLGVAYVLDGSVRKSGSRMRVAARLVRADDGYVAWSETYDRRFDDVLMIQDDIASEVTRALMASIEGRSDHDRRK